MIRINMYVQAAGSWKRARTCVARLRISSSLASRHSHNASFGEMRSRLLIFRRISANAAVEVGTLLF
jgi:hypothetical protein